MTELNSKIVEVTVYNDRARVTRRGAMHLESGTNRLSFTNLPLTLNPESARASAPGDARACLLGLEIERAYFIETPSEQIHQLEDQIENLLKMRSVALRHRLNLPASLELTWRLYLPGRIPMQWLWPPGRWRLKISWLCLMV